MHFFFDESGDFTIPKVGEHKCGVVCGLVVPETIKEALRKDFEAFILNLPDEEKDGGEPKGRFLTDESREHFCKLLNAHSQVFVTPTTLDLSKDNNESLNGFGTNMKKRLYESAKKCVYETLRDQIEELGRQWSNLSDSQGLRLVALTRCFWEAIRHSVLFHCGKEYEKCWDPLDFVVDAVQARPLTREQLVFETMVLMWLTAWSKQLPLETIEEIHTESHPFIKTYATEDGFDLGKMLRGNIRFLNSKDSWELQMVDICSNIVYQAVHDLNNYNYRLGIFRLLMRNCPYGVARGPGLITIDDKGEGRPTPKFNLLWRVMHSNNKTPSETGG